MAQFKNSARPLKDGERSYVRDGSYAYDRPSPYLYVWNSLLQTVVSQAATVLLTGKFHDKQCAIYKCEGGCNVPGVNELVLNDHSCYWDWDRSANKTLAKQLRKVADMISHIVLGWNPNDPVQSMLSLAVEFVNEKSEDSFGTTVKELDAAIRDGDSGGGPFGGNSLSSFFNHNPFGKFPIDRNYLRFCLTKFNNSNNKTDAEVDQQFADEDLGDALLKDMNMKTAERDAFPYTRSILCCSPKRSKDGVKFWLNGIVSGWFNETQIRELISRIRAGATENELKNEFSSS